MAFSTPIHTNEQSVERVLRAGLPLLLVFWRKDCAPCQQLDAALDHLAAAFAGKALIAKIEAQDNPALLRRYEVAQLPGLVFVKDGQPVERASGAAPEESLRAWLNYLVAGGARPTTPSGPSVPLNGTAPQPSPQPHAKGQSAGPTTGVRPSETPDGPITLSDTTFDRVIGGSAQPVLVDF